MSALCDTCIFRVATDEFRCIAKVGTEPVEAPEGKDPLECCWGYIAQGDPVGDSPLLKALQDGECAQ